VLLPAFEYVRPRDVAEAVALLAGRRNARPLGGGQTLLNALKLRLVQPEVLVDVSRLEELRSIAVDPDGSLRLGAAVTYDEVAASPLVREHQPLLAAMSGRLVDRMVRSRGTVGGNVCLADPTSNYPPLFVALDAELRLRGPAGPRAVAAGDFHLAPYVTALRPGELLCEVVLPPLAPDEGVGYESLQVGTDSWALARACARVRGNGTVTAARVVLGCSAVPVRQPALEAALVGAAAGDVPALVDAHAGEDFDPPADVHASAAYRTHLARVMARRAVLAAMEGHA
jgi:carbon-monoxide dehydrogenase medium subunit